MILVLIYHFPGRSKTSQDLPPSPWAQTIPATPGSPGMCVPAQPGQKPCAAGTCAQGHAQDGLSGRCGNEGPPPAQVPQGSAPDSCSVLPVVRKRRGPHGKNDGTASLPRLTVYVSSPHAMTCCGFEVRILWV